MDLSSFSLIDLYKAVICGHLECGFASHSVSVFCNVAANSRGTLHHGYAEKMEVKQKQQVETLQTMAELT